MMTHQQLYEIIETLTAELKVHRQIKVCMENELGKCAVLVAPPNLDQTRPISSRDTMSFLLAYKKQHEETAMELLKAKTALSRCELIKGKCEEAYMELKKRRNRSKRKK
jgi:hypothetical protein